MEITWKLIVGLYLNSDDSLEKTQRICRMSMVWGWGFSVFVFVFYIWYHHIPIESPSETRESSSNCSPASLRGFLSHALPPSHLLPRVFGTGHFSFWNGWLTVSHPSSTIHFKCHLVHCILRLRPSCSLSPTLTLGKVGGPLSIPPSARLTGLVSICFPISPPNLKALWGRGWCSLIYEPPVSSSGLGVELVFTGCLMNGWVSGKKMTAFQKPQTILGIP